MDRNKNTRCRRRRRKKIRIFGRRIDLRSFVLFSVFLMVFIITSAMLIGYGVHSMQRKRDNALISSEYEQAFAMDATAGPVPSPTEITAVTAAPQAGNALQENAVPSATLAPYYHDFSGSIPMRARELYNQNNDLVGWLRIKGVVSLPVVQRDNSYYLDHDFNGRKNDGGTLFLDEHHPMAPETQHLLIHGHNMYDSSMFGIVSTYNQLSRVKNYGFASFSTLHAPEEYVVCAVVRVSPDVNSPTYFDYVGTADFVDEADFTHFANELKERSMFDIPIDMQPSDSLLSLATCVEDDRLLVVFRRIREGESREVLQLLLSQAAKK